MKYIENKVLQAFLLFIRVVAISGMFYFIHLCLF
jgi:hypothetical protein